MQALKAKAVVDARFEIVELLGAGGMGIVYKAMQLDLDRPVALKFLLPHLLEDEHSLARFKIEAEALSVLNHPNITSFYAYGVWHGRSPYIAMQYLDGPSLSDVLLREGGRLSWRRTLDIVSQICSATAYAHRHGIIHRDLKPANVFLIDDRVKITDFGLAKIMEEDSELKQKLTATGFTLGTAQYMSPEQARGEKVTASTDIYAAGCIMYQCLFSRPPFEGHDAMEIFWKKQQLDFRIPSNDQTGDVPAGVLQIIQTALSKHAEDRFASADEMAAAIDAVIKDSQHQRDGKSSFIGGSHAIKSDSGIGLHNIFSKRKQLLALTSIIALAVTLYLNIGSLQRIRYDVELQAAHKNNDAFQAANIELQQIALYRKMNQTDGEQETLNNLAVDVSNAVKSNAFTQLTKEGKRQFLTSGLYALARWQPSKATDVGNFLPFSKEVEHIDFQERTFASTLYFSLWDKFAPRTTWELSLPLAQRIFCEGENATFRKISLELFERTVHSKPLSQLDLIKQIKSVEDSAQAGEITDAKLAALPIYYNYCLYDQSHAAREALRTTTRAIYRAQKESSYQRPDFVGISNQVLEAHYSSVGDTDAIAFYRDAIENQLARTDYTDHQLIAKWQRNLGDALRDRGQMDEALKLYDSAIQHEMTATGGKRSDTIACSKLSQGDIFCDRKEWHRAEQVYNYVHARRPEVADYHAIAADDKNPRPYVGLIGVDAFMKRFHDEVAPNLKPGVTLREDERYHTYEKLLHIADTYVLIGAPKLAPPAYDRAWDFAAGQRGDWRGTIAEHSARVYSLLNDESKCLAACRSAIAEFEKLPTDRYLPGVIATLKWHYARSLARFGHFSEASKMMVEANTQLEKVPSLADREWARKDMDADAPGIYVLNGDKPAAIAAAKRALDYVMKNGRTTSTGYDDEECCRGQIALLEGNAEKAETHFRKALYLISDCHHPDYAKTMTGLAKARLAQGDRAEAKRLFAKSLVGWQTRIERFPMDVSAPDYRDALRSAPTNQRASPQNHG